MELLEITSYSIAALSVGIYSGFDFNRPEYSYREQKNNDEETKEFWDRAEPGLPKYMTELSRYQVYRMAFVLFATLVFFVISFLLPVTEIVEQFIKTSEYPEILTKIARPVSAALLLLGIVKVKYIELPRQLLFGRFKTWLHYVANIPAMGRNVYENLCFQPIEYESEIAKNNISNLLEKNYTNSDTQRKDILESDFRVGNPRSITWKWARLSYGINIIEEWSLDPVYDTQLKEASLKWLNFRQLYINNIDEIIKHRAGELSEDQKIKLSRDVDTMLANCHRLIACLVFMVAKSTEDPLVYLKNAGYQVSPRERYTIGKGEFARILLAIFPTIIVIAFAFTVLPTHLEINAPDVINYFFCASIIMAFPVYFVFEIKEHMAIKQKWRKVTKDNYYNSFFEMPLKLYSCISFFAWIAVTTLMMLYTNYDELIKLYEITKWETMAIFSLIGAVTAFFTAYRVDVLPIIYSKRIDCIIGRSKGALLHGFLTGAIVWAGLDILQSQVGILEFPLFGFFLAMVLNYTLFYKKHKYNTRSNIRKDINEPITAIVEGKPVKVILIDKSPGGAGLQTEKKYILSKGTEVEIITGNNIREKGIVVETKDNRTRISFTEA